MTALRDMSPPLLLVLCGLIIGLADSPVPGGSALLIPFLIWDFSCRQSWAGVPAVGLGISIYTRSVNQQHLPVLRSLCNSILDQILWLTAAPIRLLTYALFGMEFVRRRDAGWATLRRSVHRSTTLSHRFRLYCPHTLFGLTVAAVLLVTDSWAVWWIAPVLLSWILAVPLTLAFGSQRIGALTRRAGILPITEEQTPPPIMTRAHELSEAIREELPRQAWHAALTEETAMAVHHAFLAHGAPLTLQDREAAAAAAAKYRAGTVSTGDHTALTDAEKIALLREPERLWRGTPATTPVIRFPAAEPTRMPDQQLTRQR
jgi:membrane glycosyltransferase